MRTHDLIVIGTGSGNSIVDHRFDDWDVAIVEEGTFGGTCLNVGCIPSKMFVHTADIARTVRGSSRFGVDSHLDGLRWPDIRDRVFDRIDPIAADGEQYRRKGANITVYGEHVRFVGAKTLRLASGAEITAEQIVVAAGGRPVIPEIPGLDGPRVHTSDTIMRIEALPRSMTVVGGGVIAAEMAHVFSSLGTDVTVVARSPRLMMAEDRDVSTRFTEAVRGSWDLRLETLVDSVEESTNGHLLRLRAPDGADRGSVDAELILVATGRVPNSDLLDVAAGGIATHPDGRVVVDAEQRTSVPGVWALGDICSEHQLKHVANHEARTVQHNLLNPDDLRRSDHRFVPHAVFTSPQIASVGPTEDELVAAGTPYTAGVEAYASIAYGWAMEDHTGFAKVLADPATGQLLGAHIMGPQASSVIQPLIQAMSFGLPAHEMARGQYWIHPAMPEVVENALLNL